MTVAASNIAFKTRPKSKSLSQVLVLKWPFLNKTNLEGLTGQAPAEPESSDKVDEPWLHFIMRVLQSRRGLQTEQGHPSPMGVGG